jgi:Tfp pilus assembly protein PilF
MQVKQPPTPFPTTFAAKYLAQRKDFAAARASFEKATALDPRYFPALASLVDLDVNDKKPEAAIARMESELSREPRNYRALGIWRRFARGPGHRRRASRPC